MNPNPIDSWFQQEVSPPLLLLGPSKSGKTSFVQDFLERSKKTCHEIALACPERGISTITYLQKRLAMKDVMCLISTPVYTIDSLDTMLAGEKTVITDLVKLIKSQGPLLAKKKLIFIASSSIDRKITELKKLCTVVQLQRRNRTAASAPVEDEFTYNLQDSITLGAFGITRYLSTDPWLSVLGITEELDQALGPTKHSDFMRGFMTWSKIISQSSDDFFHEDTASIATAYIAQFIIYMMQRSRTKKKGGSGAGAGSGGFTHLLTLHSVRKRTWTERYESGLPWMNDPHCRLGSKFSENTVDGLWKAL